MLGYTAILASGCSPERQLARKYLKSYKGTGVLIVPAYEIYKDNLTISYDSTIAYQNWQLDSIAWAQSVYINHLSDSIFLTEFTNNLIQELSQSGYDVYVDESMDVFLSLPDPKWIVQLSQIQLNEMYYFHDYQMYSIATGEPYTIGYKINKVELNTWLDVSKANAGNKQVLYLEAFIEDKVKMSLDMDIFEGTVQLIEHRDSVTVESLYQVASESGVKHAELLLDYFMNDYIRENLPAGIIDRRLFSYRRNGNKLTRGINERFDVVTE